MPRLNSTLCRWLSPVLLACLLHGLPAQAQTQPAQQLQQAQAQDRQALILVAHEGFPAIDRQTAQRLFTGRAVEVGGMAAVPVNAASGSKARERFVAQVMLMDDDKYVAYWTVRKHIGKGTPPREFKSPTEVMDFVQNTPGAIGYVTAGDLRPGMNVVFRP